MSQLRILLVFFVLSAILLVGCAQTYETKTDYFNGAVLVEYHQVSRGSQNDTLTMSFMEKGVYDVKFSYTKGFENDRYNRNVALPKDFSITITDSPKVKVISEYILPGFLTVAVTHGEATETHDFK